ncbi:ABC transporter ATP-binding protein [Geminicoccus roseus]|uniref:ABC transporter ATP-binding protein n=1 Tax=Geminicoccus roseus TaxID=404900 RepID=UPI0004228341|nr:ABC transporter ATP-binding protein [Geminicoccus roseus]
MTTIDIRDVTKVYPNGFKAVEKINLSVGQGEVMCLLGPSGCGKTTTLRMVAGLEDITEGECQIGGRRVNELLARERNVAMAFQFYALYPSLTVAENLKFPLHAEGRSQAEMDAKVAQVAKTLQLDGVLDRKPSQLSEGEKQRVAVGRSIIRDPECFLFDEPLSRLDVSLREQMRGEIKEVLSGLSKATVIVTHDQLEALTMASRIAVMRAGIIEQVATPHDIFARPANLFVAGFIGTPQMNVIPATYKGMEAGFGSFVLPGGQNLMVQVDPAVSRLAPGSAVTIGIRPRNLEIVPEPVADGLSFQVDIVEPMGAETLAHLSDGTQSMRVVCDWRVAIDEGDRLHVRFQPGYVHVFGPDEQAVRS